MRLATQAIPLQNMRIIFVLYLKTIDELIE